MHRAEPKGAGLARCGRPYAGDAHRGAIRARTLQRECEKSIPTGSGFAAVASPSTSSAHCVPPVRPWPVNGLTEAIASLRKGRCNGAHRREPCEFGSRAVREQVPLAEDEQAREVFADGERPASVGAEDAKRGGESARCGAGRVNHTHGSKRVGDGVTGARVDDVTVAAAGDRREIVGVPRSGQGAAGEGNDPRKGGSESGGVTSEVGRGRLLDRGAPGARAGRFEIAADLGKMVGRAECGEQLAERVGRKALGQGGKVGGKFGDGFAECGR